MPDEFDFPYTSLDLTQEVNKLPNEFGLLNALNIAPVENKASKYVRIEFREGVIYVLAAKDRGDNSDLGGGTDENAVILEIPHFPHLETIKVGDVDSFLQVVNGQIEPRSLDRELLDKMTKIRKHHSITLEYIRQGMLRGLIKDGKGRTLYNLYEVFGITPKTVDLKLGTAGTNIREKLEEVSDHIVTNLRGETSRGVDINIASDLFGRLIAHANVEKFWVQAQNSGEHQRLNREYLGGNWGRVFDFGPVRFREDKTSLPIKAADGSISSEKSVPNGKGYAYPVGTQSMMRTFQAPPYHIQRVNEAPTEDDMIFISVKELDHGEGFELKSQSNRIAINKQPECVVEVYSSD